MCIRDSYIAVCVVGVRCYKVHLLCGGIMRLMSLLEMTVNRYATQLRLTYVHSQSVCLINANISHFHFCCLQPRKYVGYRIAEAPPPPSTGAQCGTVCHQHCMTAACH